ncbi:MAG: protease inhibitor I42 family protein [Phycisphaerales bacterium]|nr:protease inhibitor I42 family protein [Phycisphaerales bacterium]
MSIMLLLIAGCQTSSTHRAEDSSISQQITVKVKDTALLTLPITAGTGYDWVLDRSKNALAGHVTVSRAQSEMPTGILGGTGVARWEVTGVTPGVVSLHFMYRRPWEADQPPVRKAVILVTVQGPDALGLVPDRYDLQPDGAPAGLEAFPVILSTSPLMVIGVRHVAAFPLNDDVSGSPSWYRHGRTLQYPNPHSLLRSRLSDRYTGASWTHDDDNHA